MTARLTLLAALLTTACASHEGESDPQEPDVKPRAGYELQPDQPEPEPEPEPEPLTVARVSISSVQMINDCPDPIPPRPTGAPAQAPAKSASQPAPVRDVAPGAPAQRSRRGAGRGYAPIRQPCTQSMMQLAFTDHGPEKARVRIQEVRILAADGKTLDEVKFRGPMAWRDDTYTPWDEMLAPDSDLKASYLLTPPDWSKVERRLDGTSSFGPSFRLEVDVEIAGQLQTVRSPEFVRERDHVIVT